MCKFFRKNAAPKHQSVITKTFSQRKQPLFSFLRTQLKKLLTRTVVIYSLGWSPDNNKFASIRVCTCLQGATIYKLSLNNIRIWIRDEPHAMSSVM